MGSSEPKEYERLPEWLIFVLRQCFVVTSFTYLYNARR